MPRVGDKHYPYTAKGQAAAKAAAKRKGVKVSHGKGYNKGGSVSKSRVNLGAGAPKRKTRKKRAVKMQGGGPAINPNVNVLGVGAAKAHQAAQRGGLAGQQRLSSPRGPGPMAGGIGARQLQQPPPPPAPRIRPGMKKGGGVKKKKGGSVKK
jgi:hypothetical protein